MPELPEVETIKRGLAPYLENSIILDIIFWQPKLRFGVPSDLKFKVSGQKIIDITRRGKYLLLKLNNGSVIIHLGMSGSLRLLQQAIPLKPHDHVDFLLSDNKILRYHDPRRFGAILFTDLDPLLHPLLKSIGVEPLLDLFNGEYLYAQTIKRKMPIKNCLLNSKVVAGIGNIYATEALFLAKIHPKTLAKNLSLKDCERLVIAIKETLHASIKAGGTSLKDYINSKGEPGYFAQQLLVYGRANLPCVVCGQKITSINLGQRCTTCCENCQVIG